MFLIPKVKHMEIRSGFLSNKSLCVDTSNLDSRLVAALKKLPGDPEGTPLSITIDTALGEAYELCVSENSITIHADGPAGAFYAIQTLRQIYEEQAVPCLYIQDYPDFSYRGFYHDVTRGKIATVQSIKQLIANMAYYKLNSLQLYVEHVFEFEETKGLRGATGFLTKEEIREIGTYCRENFVDFIPSLSTFGHMYELLEQAQYRHLRVLKNYVASPNFWRERMSHHTIDPFDPESIAFVQNLINQYAPHFDSDTFNICCDETFDLKQYQTKGLDVGAIYLEFVKKIIAHIRTFDKKVMLWGDILLEHPEAITELPDDILLLNWYYDDDLAKMEQKISKFAEFGRKQIVCPGTATWNRLCENVDIEEINIFKMIEIGYSYGALGVLNTNWGDWGNACSLELGMYGMVLGAEKSWSVNTALDSSFYRAVNALLYGSDSGIQALKRVSKLNDLIRWCDVANNYFEHRYGTGKDLRLPDKELIARIQKEYLDIAATLSGDVWGSDEYRQEMLLAAEGVCVMAEVSAILAGYTVSRVTDTRDWLNRYRTNWLQKNKVSELRNIEDMFCYYDGLNRIEK